ncbi:MAG TPA: hypothetical protein VFV80_00060 [Geminicoccaceae bacterium]|nr:hypothetical protein [Geminicoccaceae bacterium]
MKLVYKLRNLIVSPIFYTALMHAFSGLGFAGASLVLAFFLPPVEYGVVALLVALLNTSIPLSAIGMDGAILRRQLDFAPRLLGVVLLTSLAAGSITFLVGHAIYDLRTIDLLVLLPTIMAGGMTFLAAAQFQSAQRFPISVALNQSVNFCLLFAAVIGLLLGATQAWLLLLILFIGYLLTAGWSWTTLLRQGTKPASAARGIPWRDAIFYAAATGAGLLLQQMERLLTPKVLSLYDLATFGVVAAVVVAPFRSLEMAVGFTLLPRLRAASGPAARRRLLVHDGKSLALLIVVGSIVTWYVAPLIIEWLLAGKYQIGAAIFTAAIFGGAMKVLSSAARAIATALCSTRELGYLSVLLWLSVALAVAGGIVGSHFGLAGLIYGVAIGTIGRGLAAAFLAAPHLRGRDDAVVKGARVIED